MGLGSPPCQAGWQQGLWCGDPVEKQFEHRWVCFRFSMAMRIIIPLSVPKSMMLCIVRALCATELDIATLIFNIRRQAMIDKNSS